MDFSKISDIILLIELYNLLRKDCVSFQIYSILNAYTHSK